MATGSKKNRRELLVYGYIREIEKTFQIRNIPQDINDLIYLFQKYSDEWSIDYSHEDYTIFPSNLITASGKRSITAFGSHVVSEGKFVWRIKIISLVYSDDNMTCYPPYVGIIEDKEAYIKKYIDDSNFEEYGYQLSTLPSFYGVTRDLISQPHGRWNNENDVLEIELDLDELTLKFVINDDRDNVSGFKKIKKARYRLALNVLEVNSAKFELL